MYESFYGLRERPFALTPDPDYLYPSRVHTEALGCLRYGIQTHAGFTVITGAIGSGKTTLLQTLLRELDEQTTVAHVVNTLLDPRELLEATMIDLGLDVAGRSKPAMLKQFGDFLVNERTAGRIVLLVIDEAQNLALPALEETRMLSNLETEKSKLLQIILVGQPDLRDKLARRELEQLRQRITISYHLEPLDADETAHYINHRLARAAIGAPMEFPREATDRIHSRSGGVPRVINVIADAALVFGYGEERSEIDGALVDEVIRDLDETGVLGPAIAPGHRTSVASVDPNPTALVEAGSGAVATAAPFVVERPEEAPVASEWAHETPFAGEWADETPVASERPEEAPVASEWADEPPSAGEWADEVPSAGEWADETSSAGERAHEASSAGERADEAPVAGERADDRMERDLAERERQLGRREQEIAIRERQLVEQRRILAEQNRLLRSRPTWAQNAAWGQAPAARSWPPPAAASFASPPAQRPAEPGTLPPYQPRRGVWRRVKDTLFGAAKPVLEDSW